MQNEVLSDRFNRMVELYEEALASQDELRLPMPRGIKDDDNKDLSLFKSIRLEIYNFFCSSDEEYKSAREELGDDFNEVSTYVAGAVAGSLAASGVGVPVLVLTAAVTMLLKATLKIGHKSLCAYVSKYGLDEV